MNDKTMSELIALFEKDIIHDVHGLRTKVNRSDAGKEIRARGVDVLPDIAKHLNNKARKRSDDEEIKVGWGLLLALNRKKFEDEKDVPSRSAKLGEWFEWACTKDQAVPV